MNFRWGRMMARAMAALVLSLVSVACGGGEPAQPAQPAQPTENAQSAPNPELVLNPPSDRPLMSDEVFTNVQLLKGIPVDQFLETMGMFAGALLFDCVSCHDEKIVSDPKAFAIATPKIQKARGMIRMVKEINQKFFDGEQRVTCFSCHHGDDIPDNVPSLTLQYGEQVEDPYELEFFPTIGTPPATEIFDRYFKALGGADRVAKFTSYIATGTYSGYDTELKDVPMEMYGNAPNQRFIDAKGSQGATQWVFDGTVGWRAQAMTAAPLIRMSGGNLAGEKIEATMMFPAAIPKAYDDWQVGYGEVNGRQAYVVFGTKEGQSPLALYFDTESNLLVRFIRWSTTAVGNVPKQVDWSDYRQVAGAGIQMPFTWRAIWTGGETNIHLKEIKPNVQIDPAKFARPPVPRRY